MREDLLHFIWKHRKIPFQGIATTNGETLAIKNFGQHNEGSGPDFFNGKIDIGGQLWAGNIEMHLKSSDWYAHGHETDLNYNNVILHVVWQDDVAVFRRDGSQIPTLQVMDYVDESLLKSYRNLLENPKTSFINCESDFGKVDSFLLEGWLERLFFERLEQKSTLVFELLQASKNDWEKVLFCLLMKNFGLNINGSIFLEIAKNIDFSVIRKLMGSDHQLEALLLGSANLLHKDNTDKYCRSLNEEYKYLKHKYALGDPIRKPEFYGLRPNNFPTIRLAQLAQLYVKHQNLFDAVIKIESPKGAYDLFNVGVSDYWQTHFTFGRTSKKSNKKLTNNFVELLMINTVIPLKFCYAKHIGKESGVFVINLASHVAPEKNSIVKKYDAIGSKTKNAFQSQSKIQLYNEYCSKNRCLSCAVGAQLLKGNI